MSSKQNKQQQVLFLCPLTREYDDVYLVIRQAVEKLGAKVYRVDEILFSGSIIEQIYASIETADLIICDVSENQGNVMYELGYAHALQKSVLPISQKKARLPFNLQTGHIAIYDR